MDNIFRVFAEYGRLTERETPWVLQQICESLNRCFKVHPNFHECFCTSIETRRKGSLFILGNIVK